MILGQGLREECDQEACWEGESLCQVTEHWIQVERAGGEGTDRAWRLGGPAPGNSLTPGAQPPGTALGPACSLKSFDCV